MSKVKAKQQAKGNWFEKFFSNPLNPYKIILLVSVLLYAQILTFGLVHFDDHGFVLLAADKLKLSNIPDFFKHNVFWVTDDTSPDIYYRPLQNVVYAICNTLSTKQPWIYHLTGLLLHIAVSFALFNFLKELKYHSSACLLFTLIFCVHPVLVQGVAWIAGVGDQMAALFSLLSASYFIRLLCPSPNNNRVFAPASVWILHLLCLTCALFSKEISIAVIPLCLFYVSFINKNKVAGKTIAILSVGWTIVVAIYLFVRSHAILPGKVNMLTSAVESFKVNGMLVFEYFEKMFLPYRLSPLPSRDDAHVLIGVIIFLILILIFIFKKRITPMSIFGALWFVVFLFPTFVQINPHQSSFYAFEHRLYLPLIGILIVIMELTKANNFNFHSNYYQYGFLTLLLTFFIITFSYSRTFKNGYNFFDREIAFSPKSALAYVAYANTLLEDKNYAEGVEAYKKSYMYGPKDLETTGKIADVYLKNLNNPQEAIVWFKKTFDIDSASYKAAVSIGDTYFNFLHDTSSAVEWYDQALKIDPRNEFALTSLGVIYTSKGKNTEARTFLLRSIELNPENLNALKWIAISYYNEGKISDALTYLAKAYEKYPSDIDLQRNLMICYYKLNDLSNTGKFAAEYSKSNNQVPAEIENYLKSNRH